MLYEISQINESDQNKIIEFLNISYVDYYHRSVRDEIYIEVEHIVDNKILLIAKEMYQIMNNANHPYNFLPHNEAWEMYTDIVLNGSTIINEMFDDQLHILAKKVSKVLCRNCIKAINYFYGDVECVTREEEGNIMLEELSTEIDRVALHQIEGELIAIVEKEQEEERQKQYELEEIAERQEIENGLYVKIDCLNERLMNKEINIGLNSIDNIRYIKVNKYFDEHFYRSEIISCYDELIEMKTEEIMICDNLASGTQLVKLQVLKFNRQKEILKLKKIEANNPENR